MFHRFLPKWHTQCVCRNIEYNSIVYFIACTWLKHNQKEQKTQRNHYGESALNLSIVLQKLSCCCCCCSRWWSWWCWCWCRLFNTWLKISVPVSFTSSDSVRFGLLLLFVVIIIICAYFSFHLLWYIYSMLYLLHGKWCAHKYDLSWTLSLFCVFVFIPYIIIFVCLVYLIVVFQFLFCCVFWFFLFTLLYFDVVVVACWWCCSLFFQLILPFPFRTSSHSSLFYFFFFLLVSEHGKSIRETKYIWCSYYWVVWWCDMLSWCARNDNNCTMYVCMHMHCTLCVRAHIVM